MLIRLYFLFPDGELARKFVSELGDHHVPSSRIYACCRNPLELTRLPRASTCQRLDLLRQIEHVLWRSDLLVFFIALAVLIATLFLGVGMWTVLALVVMALSFLVGDLFAVHMPNVHLDEFRDALAHNEILLMVDVQQHQIAQIEELAERHHPAAVAGGSSWTLGLKGV